MNGLPPGAPPWVAGRVRGAVTRRPYGGGLLRSFPYRSIVQRLLPGEFQLCEENFGALGRYTG